MLFRDVYYLGEDFELRRGDIAVRGGVIEYAGERAPAGDWGETISHAERLVLPGFVNAHCHVPMTLLRGYGEGLPLDRWLAERVFPFEDRMTAEDVYWGSLVGIAEMLASGVTSFSDMYGFCGAICEAVKVSGIKANISRGLTSADGGALGESRGFYETEELFAEWDGACGGRIIAEASIHAEYTSHEGFVRELAAFAKARGAGIHIHLSETRKEHEECLARRGTTPTEYFEACGIFESRVTAAHCVHISDGDMNILARRGVCAAHCPTSNLKLGSGVAPVPRMLVSGVAVALGTDGASSNNNLNMAEEAHIASILHRGVNMDAALTPTAEILKMASLSGARAQGRSDTGAVKPGFKADLAVLKLDGRPHLGPLHDILGGAVFSAQAGDIEMTVADGEILYRNGEFLTFDIREALGGASAAAARIARELRGAQT
ncbi:MAG: amidohydrolase [Oscillospiraceae bacterium]|jgi:5-methylthioadenosine/S-adenosylhomocysteine deaminase|nr:amidohydrolase [Oscillospiraceae bacterium]